MRKYKHNANKNNFSSNSLDLDKKLITSLSKSKIPSFSQLKYIGKYLNPREKKIISLSFFVILLSLAFLGIRFYQNNIQIVPVQGGEYIEGLTGKPRFINPLYASSDVDLDISKLVFSSLFTHDKEGKLVKDLASDFEVSEDNKAYTIKIRNDVKWHNGDPLTVHDIIFTFNTIKEPNYKSSLRNSFLGVDIEQVDDETVKFILEEPYAAFLEFLTFGIIPESIWMQIPPETASLAELNLKPIGSGPYKFKSLVKDKSGNIKTYNLILNDGYYDKEHYLKNLTFKFFINVDEMVDALNNGLVDGLGYLPSYAKKNIVSPSAFNFYDLNLPHLTALFFNQKNNAYLKNKEVRQALAHATNKKEIVSDIFDGGVKQIDGPILSSNFAYKNDIKKYEHNTEEAIKLFKGAGFEIKEITDEQIEQASSDLESEDEDLKKEAEKILSVGKGSWLFNDGDDEFLKITITTVDNKDNVEVIQKIKEQWEKVGVRTDINIVSSSEIQFNVIKPRNFEVLFYGQVVGNDPDIYVFWHSSQVGENGLNISNYENSDVDKLLEEARLINDEGERAKKYYEFQDIISDEVPAIFMYSPVYTYVQRKEIKGFDIKNILRSNDRFDNISDWYIKTGKKIVW